MKFSADKLVDRLSCLSKDDSNYMVVALASVISASESGIDGFLTEVFNVRVFLIFNFLFLLHNAVLGL